MALSCVDIESLENILSLQSLLSAAYAHCGIMKYASSKLVTRKTIYEGVSLAELMKAKIY